MCIVFGFKSRFLFKEWVKKLFPFSLILTFGFLIQYIKVLMLNVNAIIVTPNPFRFPAFTGLLISITKIPYMSFFIPTSLSSLYIKLPTCLPRYSFISVCSSLVPSLFVHDLFPCLT